MRILLGLSLGRRNSRGLSPAYFKPAELRQSAPPAPENVLPQGVPAEVRAAAMEPTLLPGSGVPEVGSPLAGRPAASEAAPSGGSQSPTGRGPAQAPSAGQDRGASHPAAGVCARAWSRGRNFFSLPLCDRPGCHEPPQASVRNPAKYCGPACRRAVHNVLDRERKWRTRGTLDGRKKRALEYRSARPRRGPSAGETPPESQSRAPPT